MPAGIRERETYLNALSNSCDGQLLLGDLDRALVTCRRVTELRPDEPIGFYNLAGAFALAGRREEALAALRRNIELGDTDWAYLEHDRWFEDMHGDPRFEEILAAMKRATERESGARGGS